MNVLFVCVGNTARSQLAEEAFNSISNHTGTSAGMRVAEYGLQGLIVDELKKDERTGNSVPIIEAAAEAMGLNISNNRIKQVTEEMVQSADKVILLDPMTPPDFIANSEKVELWTFDDPLSVSEESARQTFEAIRQRIVEFVKELP